VGIARLLLRLTIAGLLVCAWPVERGEAAVLPSAGSMQNHPALARSAALRSFYERQGFGQVWLSDGEGAARRAGLVAVAAVDAAVDPRVGAMLGQLSRAPDPADPQAAEIAWTEAFLGYVERRNGGVPVTDGKRLDAALRIVTSAATRQGLQLQLASLEIVNVLGGWRRIDEGPAFVGGDGDLPVSQAEVVLAAFVRAGPVLPESKTELTPGVQAGLRARLLQSADLSPTGELDAGLRRFQQRHGLLDDGVLGPRTKAALRTPVRFQMSQIELNLVRDRQREGRDRLERYVVVNVPGYELDYVERGEVRLHSRVIVGEVDNQTPIFDDRIRYIELNPYWYVPGNIVPELMGQAREHPGYFERNDFIVRGGHGEPVGLVQRPGPRNTLGQIKFLFPNSHAVYLHDTSQRGLFGRSARSLSHGCVRVEKPKELAVALLGRDGWTADRLEGALARARTQRIDLSTPVPIFIDYTTAFVDDQGRLNLRDDLYGHDRDGTALFREKGLRAPPLAVPVVRPVRPEQGPLDVLPQPRSPQPAVTAAVTASEAAASAAAAPVPD
jgi:hypothetical protein